MAFTGYKALDFSGITKAIDKIGERQSLAALGQGLDGTPEGYAKAAQALLQKGDTAAAANFFALSQKARESNLTDLATRDSPFNMNRRAPASPAATGIVPLAGLGVQQPPKQGVHIAETEDDVQRLERATGMVTTDADREAIVKTVYGEAANQPVVGQQAVAAVIRNRANQAGLTPEQITQQRNQFEPWNTEAGRARMNNIPDQRFQQIAGTVAPVIEQGLDPTGGATHFYAPKAQAALGRAVPKWDNGTGQPIADHTFFKLGYGQGGGTPAPSPQTIIAQAPQGEPVQMAQAPAQPGAPVPDVPVQGGAEVQGNFRIPGPNQLPDNDPRPDITTPQLLEVLANPRLAQQHPLAKFILDGRQKYSDENAPEKREQTRLATEKARLETQKLRREVEGEGARPMTPAERESFGVPRGQPAFMNSKGEPKFGPAGTTVKNEGVIPPGYRAIRDAEGNLERVEPIPGSKAEREATELAEKKVKGDRIKAEVGTTVGNALDDIDRLMSSATLSTTGAVGARVAGIPGTAAHDIAQSLQTIGANISFSQLQQMREASPTGGALGAVSDTEQKLLQNSYAALSQSQSPEQFKTNLGRVRATFERIVHGRTLSAQERKTGGPMTLERAKGLREQAQQAIAGGAPRDAVLKRLKDDYGITPEGL